MKFDYAEYTSRYIDFIFVFLRKDDEPPIVPGHPLWGNGEQFNKNSVEFILDAQKKHGDVFSIRMLHYFMTVIADPHSFEAFR